MNEEGPVSSGGRASPTRMNEEGPVLGGARAPPTRIVQNDHSRGMRLVIEFLPPIGESLDEARISVESALDKELGELKFEKGGSYAAVSPSRGIRQRIFYKLKRDAEPVMLKTRCRGICT